MALLTHTGRAGLQVQPGEIIAVLGAPGSGKSQLSMELALLQRPREGAVLLHGVNPLARTRTSRPREVTLLVQNAEDQLFARTVFDDVAFGPRHLNLSPAEIDERVTRALEAVRLPPEVRARSPFALSGGERRRVALAGVLAMEPEVLILDEPTANLDPQTRNEFRDLLAPLAGKAAVIWLTSSAREAALADRAYLLQNGQVTDLPAGPGLLTDWERLARSGVELPSTYELAANLRERGFHLPSPATTEQVSEAIIRGWRERHDR